MPGDIAGEHPPFPDARGGQVPGQCMGQNACQACVPGIQALGEHSSNNAGKNVTAARCGHTGIAERTDRVAARGIAHDRPGVRIDRMIEAIAVLRGLWGDATFSFDGDHYTITEMNGLPKPVQSSGPPIIVGGGAKRVLSTAARLADIVGVNPNVGEGKVGPEAIASMSADATDEKLGWVRDGAGDRFADIEISILKFVTIVTDDRDTVAGKVASAMGMDAPTLLASPHTMVGSAEQIVDELVEQRERWQGSYVTVQSDALEAFAPVVAALAGT